MWIFLSIVLSIAVLITVILLLPIQLILKTDQNGELIIRCKFLFKTFGGESAPKDSKKPKKANNPLVDTIMDALGLSRLDKENLKKSVKSGGFHGTLKESFSLILGLLKRLLALVKSCKIKVLKIKIVCAESDAAQTAIAYGRCYSLLAPLLSFVHSQMRVRKKGESIDISCNFQAPNDLFSFETVISVPIFRILGMLLGAGYDEAMRAAKEQEGKESAL